MHVYSRLVFGPGGRQSFKIDSEQAEKLSTEESLLHIKNLVLPVFDKARTDRDFYDLCMLDKSVSPIKMGPSVHLCDALRQIVAEG